MSERESFHKSWVMLDKSVVVQGLPDFCVSDTFHQIPTFGDIKVGQSLSTSQVVKSIQIKLFGLEKRWVYDRCDAYVSITLEDTDGAVKVRGFHADARQTCLQKLNSTLLVKKDIKHLSADGSCPICLETDIKVIHPMQSANSFCGHGVCQNCFMASQDQYYPKCALCRAPLPRRFDHLPKHELIAVCEYARGGGTPGARRGLEIQAWYRKMAGEPAYSVKPFY